MIILQTHYKVKRKIRQKKRASVELAFLGDSWVSQLTRELRKSSVVLRGGRLGTARGLDDAREFAAGLRGQLDHLACRVVADHRRREALVVVGEDHVVADASRRVVRLPAGMAEPCLLAVGLDEEEVHRDVADRRFLRLAGREAEHHLVAVDLALTQDAVLALVELDGSRGLAAAPVVAELERVDGSALEVLGIAAVPGLALGIRAAFLLARFAVGVEVREGERRGVAVGAEVDLGVANRKHIALVVGVTIDGDLGRGSGRRLGRRRLRHGRERQDEGDERRQRNHLQLLHDEAPPLRPSGGKEQVCHSHTGIASQGK